MASCLGRDLVWALDPVRFAVEAIQFRPDAWQADALRWAGHRLLLNCSRQSGKSTTIAVKALHRALYDPGVLVLLVSASLRQSGELFRKVVGFMRLMETAPALEEENRLSLRFANGARVVSLPGSEATIRGFSGPGLVIEDEASRVSDELFVAIGPMLAVSQGQLILMSTPYGKRGHFYEAWEHGGEMWERVRIQADECARIRPEFLKEERRVLGDYFYQQEYMCNPPEAPVWMGDLTFKLIGDVRVGDEVIGWEYHKSEGCREGRQRLVKARVLEVRQRFAPTVKLSMESGRTLRCTHDHRWLSGQYTNEFYVRPKVGRKLAHVIEPTPAVRAELEREAAWLGGIYDGEGCSNQIGQCPHHNPVVYAHIAEVLHALGHQYAPSEKGFYINGGRQGMVDFVNQTRPVKRDSAERYVLGARFRTPDTILAMQYDGWGDVVSMQTSTGNYVVWGYASKNCQFRDTVDQYLPTELVQAARRPEVTAWLIP